MTKVIHGGDIYKYQRRLLDFSSNINPLGIPESAKEVLKESWEHLVCYPDIDYLSLRQTIAAHYQLDYRQVVVGNGAAEIIFLLGQYFQGKKVMIPQPAFGEYQQAVELGGATVEMVYRDEEFRLPIAEVLAKLPEVDGLILCQPNNPDGSMLAKQELEQIIRLTAAHGITLVLDEAFIDFVTDSAERTALRWLNDHPALIVIRAFTKFFALPGLRLGYGLTSLELAERLKAKQIPWSVNSLAAKIGERLLADKEYVQASQEWITAERNYLVTSLQKIKLLRVYPTEANFILCKINDPGLSAKDLKEMLVERGILIRDASSFVGLNQSFFRVAIKDHESNQRLYVELTGIFKDR